MSVMSTGRRSGAAVRRLSPEDTYLLLGRPGAVGRGPRIRPRPRLRLVPPLPAGPAGERRPAAPPEATAPPEAAAPDRVTARDRVTAPARIVRPAGAQAGPGRAHDRAHGRPEDRVYSRPQAQGQARAHGQVRAHGQARHRVRLTRRGRIVVWVLAALTAAAVLTPVWLIAATGAQASNHGLPPAAVHAGLHQVVVRPGQTLWSIAMAAEPTADPRVVTQEIMQVNALSNQVLVPGEALWVPGR